MERGHKKARVKICKYRLRCLLSTKIIANLLRGPNRFKLPAESIKIRATAESAFQSSITYKNRRKYKKLYSGRITCMRRVICEIRAACKYGETFVEDTANLRDRILKKLTRI